MFTLVVLLKHKLMHGAQYLKLKKETTNSAQLQLQLQIQGTTQLLLSASILQTPSEILHTCRALYNLPQFRNETARERSPCK